MFHASTEEQVETESTDHFLLNQEQVVKVWKFNIEICGVQSGKRDRNHAVLKTSKDMGVSIRNGGTPISGWFTSWNIPIYKWMRGHPISGNLHIWKHETILGKLNHLDWMDRGVYPMPGVCVNAAYLQTGRTLRNISSWMIRCMGIFFFGILGSRYPQSRSIKWI